jgi:hypothetical protein
MSRESSLSCPLLELKQVQYLYYLASSTAYAAIFIVSSNSKRSVSKTVKSFVQLGAESQSRAVLSVQPKIGINDTAINQLRVASSIGDYRGAGEAIIILSTVANALQEPAEALRQEMIDVLKRYTTENHLTLVNINYVTQLVLLITGVPDGVRSFFFGVLVV